MIKDLTQELLHEISEKSEKSRGDIIAMTHLAGSGHPGGSLSSINIYTLLYHVIDMEKDKVIISHGHTSPAAYSALARKGLFDPKDVIKGFRRVGSIFEGHVEPCVPGIQWGTGNLGQGLSVACGFAVADRLKGVDADYFVVMGDGEHQKGQISEARRFIRKFNLNSITVIIDNNELQISGDRCQVMPQDFKAEYESAGFRVVDVDGHDIEALHKVLAEASADKERPYAVIAHTVMGKGISFMENQAEYHGKPLNDEQMEKALTEVTLDWPLDELKRLRQEPVCETGTDGSWEFPEMDPGLTRTYGKDKMTDNRSGFGNALLDVAKANEDKPMAVFDCDLAGSVKTAAFAKEFPDRFFQAGITEHNTATMAGAASSKGVVTVFADFGMFGIDETYNQQRLNAINNAHMKLFCTHVGIDVGEDGKTHQCIDYIALSRNLNNFSVIVPIDPNDTDRATRWALTTPGNCLVTMGRSKIPSVTDENGEIFFKDKTFTYGEAHHLRKGTKATLFALGAMSASAIEAWSLLEEEGLDIEVVGISCPLEIDPEEIRQAASRGKIFVAEDHLEVSGLASQIAYVAATNGIAINLNPIGIKGFPPSGPSKTCFLSYGLDPESLAATIKNGLK